MGLRHIGVALAGIGMLALAGAAAAEESVLDKLKKGGVLKACVAQIAPESFKDAKTGDWHGVTIDLLSELSNWMKVKHEIVEVKWDISVLSLKRADCDMFGGSFVFNAPHGWAIRYGDPDWKSFLDSFAQWAVASGTVQALYETYFERANPFKSGG